MDSLSQMWTAYHRKGRRRTLEHLLTVVVTGNANKVYKQGVQTRCRSRRVSEKCIYICMMEKKERRKKKVERLGRLNTPESLWSDAKKSEH